MLKFSTQNPRRLILGVSHANLDEIRAGRPLKIDAVEVAALGLPAMEILLYAASTQHAAIDLLREGGLLDDEQAAALHQHTTDLEARHGRPA